MKIVKPIEISDSNYTSTIAEPDASVGEVEWYSKEVELIDNYSSMTRSATGGYWVLSDGVTSPLVTEVDKSFNFIRSFAPSGGAYHGVGSDGAGSIYLFKQEDLTNDPYVAKYRESDMVYQSEVLLTPFTDPIATVGSIAVKTNGQILVLISNATNSKVITYAANGSQIVGGGSVALSPDTYFWHDLDVITETSSSGTLETVYVMGGVTREELHIVDFEIASPNWIEGGSTALEGSYSGTYSTIATRDATTLTLAYTEASPFMSIKKDVGLPGYNTLLWEEGEQAILTSTHKLYESVISNNDSPDDGVLMTPKTWVEIGGTNKYASFDTNIGNPSIAYESNPSIAPVITSTVTVAPNEFVTGVVGISVKDASTVLIEVDNGSLIYSNTIDMTGEDRFAALDLPNTDDVTITITITGFVGGESVSIGELILGPQDEIGVSQYSSSYQLLDFSRVDRDDFGNISVTKRGYADLMTFNVKIDADDFSYVRQTMESLRGTPSVWLGNDDDASKAVYGIYKDLNINWSSPSLYDCSFKIEGMT